jgi:ArsR family metal-binding transcriptional regulator
MEAALLTEDPRLVSALSASPLTPSKNRVIKGVALLLVGLVTVLAGVISKTAPIGIVGFLIALTGVITVISSFSASGKVKSMSQTPNRPKSPKNTSKLRDRLNKRWDERWDERNNQ